MADLIDRQAAKEEILSWAVRILDPRNLSTEDTMYVLDNLPTIDPESLRPKGEWKPRNDVVGFVNCSVCHECNIYDDWADGKKWNFCPNCGADMRGEK